MRLFGIGVTCVDRIALIVVFTWFEFYSFLNVKKSLFFLFAAKTVTIEPATSLLIISHPAVQMLPPVFVY